MTFVAKETAKRVLLVDDEVMMRQTCQRMLTRCGYEVIHAEDGETAVAIYQQHWESISVVLLDMIMPRMNGSATLAKLREVNPDARVILSSGFPQDNPADAMMNSESIEFMQKPYSLQQLIDTVDRISV